MKICMFGSANDRIDPEYIQEASKLGAELGRRGHELVFGAGKQAMMGAAARAAHESGARVTGISPKFFLDMGVLYEECDELILTRTMSVRKRRMTELAEGYVIMPGGYGTMDELFEILTLTQIGKLHAPIVFVNTKGFFDDIVAMIRRLADEGFVSVANSRIFSVASNASEALDIIEKEAAERAAKKPTKKKK